MTDEILHPADLALAQAAARREPAAVAQVERLVSGARTRIREVDGDAALLDEARQRLRTLLFGAEKSALDGYRGRGPLAGWLSVTFARIGLALAKERAASPPEPEDVVPSDPELDFLRVEYRDQFAAALRTALGALQPRERAMLRLAYLEGVPLESIGKLYGKHASNISRELRACRERILAATRDALAAQTGIGDSQVDSLMRMLRSEVEISLHRWL